MSQRGLNRIWIKGGHLVDPLAKIDAPRDLLIEDGRVAAVEANLKIDAQNV
jgi:dihydroorotase